MVGAVRRTWLAMQHTVPESEEAADRIVARSTRQGIMTGEMLSPENIRSIRQGLTAPKNAY